LSEAESTRQTDETLIGAAEYTIDRGGAKTIYALPHCGKSLGEVVVDAEQHRAVRRRLAFVAAERERLERLRAERRAHYWKRHDLFDPRGAM
jgi:hypothetical protein